MGVIEGAVLVCIDVSGVGGVVCAVLGETDGCTDGAWLGICVGDSDGAAEGLQVGTALGTCHHVWWSTSLLSTSKHCYASSHTYIHDRLLTCVGAEEGAKNLVGGPVSAE